MGQGGRRGRGRIRHGRGGGLVLRFGTLRGTISMFIIATTFLFVSIVGRFYFFTGISFYMQIPFYIIAVVFYCLAMMSYMRYRKYGDNGNQISGNETQRACSTVSITRSHISRHTVSANITSSYQQQQQQQSSWGYNTSYQQQNSGAVPYPYPPPNQMNREGNQPAPLHPGYSANMGPTQMSSHQQQQNSAMFPAHTTFNPSQPTTQPMGTTFNGGYPTAPSMGGTTFDPTHQTSVGGQQTNPSATQDLPPSYDEVVKNNATYGWT